jgi:hypothetical protein
MSVTLRWQVPVNDCSFDFTYIYRADSETGTYTNLANQAIEDNSYCDADGGLNHWYKVRFYNSTTFKWSDYSTPMQGGTYAGYSTVTEVREISNLTVDDISDANLYRLIQKATAYLNAEINQEVRREKISAIDDTRKNSIDGTNATFYVRKWRNHIGDMNDDGKVTVADLIVYQVDPSNVETQLTISSISPDEGKFVLSSAPAGGMRLFVTYQWSYASEYTPNAKVKLACEYLTTAFAFEKIERGLSPQQVYGNVRIYRDMAAGSENHKRYREVVNQINSEMIEYDTARNLADVNRMGATNSTLPGNQPPSASARSY